MAIHNQKMQSLVFEIASRRSGYYNHQQISDCQHTYREIHWLADRSRVESQLYVRLEIINKQYYNLNQLHMLLQLQ